MQATEAMQDGGGKIVRPAPLIWNEGVSAQDVEIAVGNVAGEYGPQLPNSAGKRCVDPLTNKTIVYVSLKKAFTSTILVERRSDGLVILF